LEVRISNNMHCIRIIAAHVLLIIVK